MKGPYDEDVRYLREVGAELRDLPWWRWHKRRRLASLWLQIAGHIERTKV